MIREADCCGKVSAGHQLALRLEEAGNGGWRKAVEVVETHLRQKALVVTVVMGRSGLVPKEPGLLRKVQCNRAMKKSPSRCGGGEREQWWSSDSKEHGRNGRRPSSAGSPGHTSCPTWLWTSFRLLCSCPKALTDSRYLWHYDQVLKAVAKSFSFSHQHQQTPSCFELDYILCETCCFPVSLLFAA